MEQMSVRFSPKSETARAMNSGRFVASSGATPRATVQSERRPFYLPSTRQSKFRGFPEPTSHYETRLEPARRDTLTTERSERAWKLRVGVQASGQRLGLTTRAERSRAIGNSADSEWNLYGSHCPPGRDQRGIPALTCRDIRIISAQSWDSRV